MKTQTEAKHTPTPWLMVHPVKPKDFDDSLDMGVAAEIDGNRKLIAECFGRVGKELFVDSKANAEFIVHAVNSHEGLLKQQGELQSTIDRLCDEKQSLLEAAKALVERVRTGYANVNIPDNHQEYWGLLKAIAQAERK